MKATKMHDSPGEVAINTTIGAIRGRVTGVDLVTFWDQQKTMPAEAG